MVEDISSTQSWREKDSNALADKLCSDLQTPVIGAPTDWEEAMHLLDWEIEKDEKWTEWQKAIFEIESYRRARRNSRLGK